MPEESNAALGHRVETLEKTVERLLLKIEHVLDELNGKFENIIRIDQRQLDQSDALQRAFAEIKKLQEQAESHDRDDEKAHAELKADFVRRMNQIDKDQKTTADYAKTWVERGRGGLVVLVAATTFIQALVFAYVTYTRTDVQTLQAKLEAAATKMEVHKEHHAVGHPITQTGKQP